MPGQSVSYGQEASIEDGMSPVPKDGKGIGQRGMKEGHNIQHSIESVRHNFEQKLNSLKEDFTRNLNDLTRRGTVDSVTSDANKGYETAGQHVSPRRSYNAHVDDILNQVNQRSAENLKGAVAQSNYRTPQSGAEPKAGGGSSTGLSGSKNQQRSFLKDKPGKATTVTQ